MYRLLSNIFLKQSMLFHLSPVLYIHFQFIYHLGSYSNFPIFSF